MTHIHNIVKNEKNPAISNTLYKTLKETKTVLLKCTKLLKTLNDWYPIENYLTKRRITSLLKISYNHASSD